MGATGDLTQRILLPALFRPGCKGQLPKARRIVGIARREYSEGRFRELIWEGVREFGGLAVRREEWATKAGKLFYIQGGLGVPEDFPQLRLRLEEIEVVEATDARLSQNGHILRRVCGIDGGSDG